MWSIDSKNHRREHTCFLWYTKNNNLTLTLKREFCTEFTNYY